MESGKEQNYWPGFVDALSNVVLTLVFVLVIFVFALVMASNKVEKRMQEVVQAQEEQKATMSKQMTGNQLGAGPEMAMLKEKLATAQAEIEKLREQLSKEASDKELTGSTNQSAVATENNDKHIAIDNKAQAKAQQGAIDVKRSSSSITLGYPLQIAEMDEKSAMELGHVLEAMTKNMGKHKVLLRSIVGKESYSAARRLAYYRAIGARNYLMTKGGEEPSNITTTIVQPPQPEDGRVEIIFQKQ